LPPVQDDSPPLEHVHYGGDGVYCSMASGYPLFACPSGDDALPDKNTEVWASRRALDHIDPILCLRA